ncbi:MAG: fumarylacetoacetate hydrolase family protein [SAR202 cluster bacterium]|nr:fumarylacetoacetate hydrolase family protein [SAR202 cluster bacterium]|tara:strand:- start:4845 stop:5789 length:945 start_codon:yes stop_codon:yes gene_type:complete
MKIVRFLATNDSDDSLAHIGISKDEGIVDIDEIVGDLRGDAPQLQMERLINRFEDLRPAISQLVDATPPMSGDKYRLLPPLPRPSKILCCIGNYWEHMERTPRPLNLFLKSPDSVVGPGDTIRLPAYTDPYVFHHEAELGIVARGPAKNIAEDNYLEAIFGYTCMIDVSARAEERRTWRSGSWMGKSFDTFGPIGPCIVTADEIPDPNDLNVKFWNNGDLRHDYNTDDMEHRVPEIIAFATNIMTLNSGDLLACGTNHEGIGPLQDGENVEMEIVGIGKMQLDVADPLKRTWERGVYMGPNSTNPAARTQQPNT